MLEKIDSPKDLKGLNIHELTALCSEIREYMIKCCAHNPGHLGASLGAVELAVALHYVFNTPEDKLIWDVGHQSYAHKIITGRREAFMNNRKQGGLSGFTKMSESKYDAFGAGHTSTSISAALGIAKAAEMQRQNIKVVAIIGDGAMTGGLAFEGLNNAGAMKSDLLVILNDNQISIDKNVGALHNYLIKMSTSQTYNKLKNSIWEKIGNVGFRRIIQKFMYSTKIAFLKHGSLFEALGFRYFGTIDGNDIGQLVTTLENLQSIKGPKLLHIRTIKGKGYSPAEKNQSVWHAPGKFDISTGTRIKSNSTVKKYQVIFGEAILQLAKEDKRIVAITPAMASGCSLNIMMNELPDRCFDVGIAEQHAVTFSAGLAAQGLLPFCNIYSTFMQRAFDNIIHDVALQRLKVIFCIDRGGLVGEDGTTHQGAFDLSYLRLIPGITVTAPMDENELRNMMYSATTDEYKGPIAIRYPRGYCEGHDISEEFTALPYGKARILREGKDVGVLTIGTIGNKAAKAIEKLCNEMPQLSIMHCDMRFLKPIDTELLGRVCSSCSTIITIEDGTIIGGLHSSVTEFISDMGDNVKVIPLGIHDKFVEQGTVEEQMTECGYNENEIYETIRKVIKEETDTND